MNFLPTSEFLLETYVLSRISFTNLFPVSHLFTLPLAQVCFLYCHLVGESIDIIISALLFACI